MRFLCFPRFFGPSRATREKLDTFGRYAEQLRKGELEPTEISRILAELHAAYDDKELAINPLALKASRIIHDFIETALYYAKEHAEKGESEQAADYIASTMHYDGTAGILFSIEHSADYACLRGAITERAKAILKEHTGQVVAEDYSLAAPEAVTATC